MKLCELHKIQGIETLFNQKMDQYTFTKVGGIAEIISFPKSISEVRQIINFCQKNDIKWIVLGYASNVIISDNGYNGMVIILTKMNHIIVDKTSIIVEAGASLAKVSKVAMQANLTGFEFACGIPGSVGGAVFMNAGAYGRSISDIIHSADILHEDGRIETITFDDLRMAYRYSSIQDKDKCVILKARFSLMIGNKEEIIKEMEDLTLLRASKQPLEYPSCGSVFKRPKGYYTGELIQRANLQGKQIGGAQVSMKHAGFIVNIEKATATDYLLLIKLIQNEIYEKFGVELIPEVQIIDR